MDDDDDALIHVKALEGLGDAEHDRRRAGTAYGGREGEGLYASQQYREGRGRERRI